MARIRAVTPAFFTDEQLGACSALARLAWLALSVEADRDGRLVERPRELQAKYFPYDAGVDVARLIDELVDRALVVRFTDADVGACLQIVAWHHWQRPHRLEPRSILGGLPLGAAPVRRAAPMAAARSLSPDLRILCRLVALERASHPELDAGDLFEHVQDRAARARLRYDSTLVAEAFEIVSHDRAGRHRA